MNRGSKDVDVEVVRDLDGFNEAPIHESGKYGQAARRSQL